MSFDFKNFIQLNEQIYYAFILIHDYRLAGSGLLKGGSPPTGKKTRFFLMRFVLGGSPPASKKTTCPETDLCSFRAISFICSNKSIGRLIVICFFSYFSGDVLIIFGCKNYILSLLNQISGNDFSHGHIQLFCSLLKFSEEDDWNPY